MQESAEAVAFVVCVSVYALLLLLSVLSQLRLLTVGDRILLQRVIPEWSFFAPNPGTMDFHLLYRDLLPGGAARPWREIPAGNSSKWYRAIWNPRLRVLKAIIDLSQLVSATPSPVPASMQVTFQYLALLNWARAQRHDEKATHFQFAILLSNGCLSGEDPLVVFVSSLHRL